MPGEIVVKFTDSVTQSATDLLDEGRPFRDATTDGSPSLDELVGRYGVERARPVFGIPRHEGALPGQSLRQEHESAVNAVKQRFPARTRRAPREPVPDLSNVYVLALPENADVAAAAAAFAADPHVEYAQPNYLLQLHAAPNDPYFSSAGSWGQPYDDLWGLKKLRAEQAWDVSQGAGVLVAVVDSGLDYNHPDIAGNVWANAAETPGNGVDDEGNGYVDDVRGWDFVTVDNSAEDNDPMDGLGHGTHVAGTIAAIGNNGLGVIGVAPQATVMPVKAFSDQGGGSMSDIANALRYAVDNGAEVINNSWGCLAPCPSVEVVEDAVRYAHSMGALLVFSAGNTGQDDTANISPQNLPEAIVVSAFDQNDVKTSSSSFGMKVDVAAPGGGTDTPPPTFRPRANILSLLSSAAPVNVGAIHPDLVVGGQYLRESGTSMAAPHVSGLAALILARQPAFTNEEVRQVLRVSADDVDLPGFDPNSGSGRINAEEALAVDSVLRALITSPTSGPSLAHWPEVEVRGTAAGPGFAEYQLSFSSPAAPNVWTPIGAPSPTQVENGVLGTWNVSGLPSRQYILRLTAVDAQGSAYDAYVPILRENPARLGASRLAFESDRGTATSDIYILDGNGLVKLTDNTATDGQPVWSPDGSKVAFVSDRDGNTEVYVVDVDGGNQTNLTAHPSADTSPTWSPDGTKIAFASNRDGNWEIYTMDAGGGGQTRLTNHPASDTSPDWSPTGGSIAFVSERDGNAEIYSIAATGGGFPYRHTANLVEDRSPAWAPDGLQIAFASFRAGNWDIYTKYSGSSIDTGLSLNAANDTEPSWSSDGLQIAFVSDRNTNTDVYVTTVPSTGDHRLTADSAVDASPRWGPFLPGAPSLLPIGERGAIAEKAFQLTVQATDPDGEPLTYGAWLLPPGASFSNQTLIWTPTSAQLGSHWVAFTASDGRLIDQEITHIHVVTASGDDDGDGLTNVEEVNVYTTNPVDYDTDDDYLHDYNEVSVYGTDPRDPDTDEDGCMDSYEVANQPPFGGGRDPLIMWDFFDVWAGLPLSRDRIVSVGDIGAVVGRFGTTRGTAPTKEEALAEALTRPAGLAGYHAAFDRSGVVAGGDLWDLLPPDGVIAVGEIGAVVAQFGHTCA